MMKGQLNIHNKISWERCPPLLGLLTIREDEIGLIGIFYLTVGL